MALTWKKKRRTYTVDRASFRGADGVTRYELTVAKRNGLGGPDSWELHLTQLQPVCKFVSVTIKPFQTAKAAREAATILVAGIDAVLAVGR